VLIQLPLTQVSDHWIFVKDRLPALLPDIADEGANVNNILYALMVGVMQLWKISDTPAPDAISRGFVLTTILGDVTDSATLLVYAVIIIDKRAKVDPDADLNTICQYAKSRGCTKIGAFTGNEKVIELLKNKGFKTTTYASMDVEGGQ
jgi:hypothetical protein